MPDPNVKPGPPEGVTPDEYARSLGYSIMGSASPVVKYLIDAEHRNRNRGYRCVADAVRASGDDVASYMAMSGLVHRTAKMTPEQAILMQPVLIVMIDIGYRLGLAAASRTLGHDVGDEGVTP